MQLRQDGITWHVAGDDVVVLDLEGSVYLKLNGSGGCCGSAWPSSSHRGRARRARSRSSTAIDDGARHRPTSADSSLISASATSSTRSSARAHVHPTRLHQSPAGARVLRLPPASSHTLQCRRARLRGAADPVGSAVPPDRSLLGVRLNLDPAPPGVEQFAWRELPPRARRQLRCTARVTDVWPFSKGPCLRRSLVIGHLLRRHRSGGATRRRRCG